MDKVITPQGFHELDTHIKTMVVRWLTRHDVSTSGVKCLVYERARDRIAIHIYVRDEEGKIRTDPATGEPHLTTQYHAPGDFPMEAFNHRHAGVTP